MREDWIEGSILPEPEYERWLRIISAATGVGDFEDLTQAAQQELPFTELEVHTTTGNEPSPPWVTIFGPEDPAPCTCTIQSLMRDGCKCGGV